MLWRAVMVAVAGLAANTLVACFGGDCNTSYGPPRTISIPLDGGLDGGDDDAACAAACNAVLGTRSILTSCQLSNRGVAQCSVSAPYPCE